MLPGGIYDPLRHRTPEDCINKEGMEEGGITFLEAPQTRIMDLRKRKDERVWCSIPTTHCLDFVTATPATADLTPRDTAEIGRAFWQDLAELDLNQDVGRGHNVPLRIWKRIQELGGWEALSAPDAWQELEALSDEETLIVVAQEGHLIRIEDPV